MGNSCEHCYKGLEDCCSYFFDGCKACAICLGPCCLSIKQALNSCSCEGLASCMECRFGNPLLIPDKSTPDIQNILDEYEHKVHYQDDWFGDAILLEHKVTKQLAVLKTDDFYYSDEYKEHIKQFVSRKQLRHDNIVQLRDFATRSEQGFCTQIFRSFLIFDYILCDFATEYEHRIQNNQPYQESEFWPIMYQCVSGMAYLHSQNISHGSIRMRNIYISSQSLKIADPHLFDTKTDYSRVFNDRRRFSQAVFLSPELMAELDKGNPEPAIDWFKSDVYAMGMVFLQLLSGVSSSLCYNYDQCVIYEDKINSKYQSIQFSLQSIKINYHDTLFYMIKNMLAVKVSQRYTFKQVQESLDRFPKTKNALFQPIEQQQPNKDLPNSIFDPIPNNDLDYGTTGLDMYSIGLMGEQSRVKTVVEQVKEKYPDGSKYIGGKRNGMRHGKGKFIHTDNSYYDGNWKDNKMHGKGVLYNSANKVVYDGQWINDQYHGSGVEYNQEQFPMIQVADPKDLTNISWTKYEGNFKNDLRDGFGTLMLSNGDKYVGEFKGGFVNGHGTYKYKNGNEVQGIWQQGIMKK